ncbi:gliding motility-associated ABC transporter permease subunit GldF [Aridibaculum aurantiacum]|uniref:gliding motility-associated ABC transporter permease subunit GldF n=1 Tax=Aridibaculum aurantiacum TaxID=2810307 RepID=UPI001A95E8A2|nr:gliding motility-associated ABC transporter permease subunit GldF [Aridibaculum aurantiacum]
MWMICKKEWRQFFSSLTGYIAIVVFLLLMGLFLFVFPASSILDFGYASLENFFSLAPFVMLFLVPTITMRSIADEYKSGTFELLKTLPVSPANIVWGKYLGCLLVVAIALLPTVVYAVSIQQLSARGGIDVGATTGSYIGLLMLGAVYTAVGICASSFTNNTVVAFIVSAFICFFLYSGFNAISNLSLFNAGADYYIEMLGIDFHYRSISRGVIDTRDIIYFFAVIFLFLLVTQRNLVRR